MGLRSIHLLHFGTAPVDAATSARVDVLDRESWLTLQRKVRRQSFLVARKYRFLLASRTRKYRCLIRQLFMPARQLNGRSQQSNAFP